MQGEGCQKEKRYWLERRAGALQAISDSIYTRSLSADLWKDDLFVFQVLNIPIPLPCSMALCEDSHLVTPASFRKIPGAEGDSVQLGAVLG